MMQHTVLMGDEPVPLAESRSTCEIPVRFTPLTSPDLSPIEAQDQLLSRVFATPDGAKVLAMMARGLSRAEIESSVERARARWSGRTLDEPSDPYVAKAAGPAVPSLCAALEAVVAWVDDLYPYSEPGTEPAPVFQNARAALAAARAGR